MKRLFFALACTSAFALAKPYQIDFTHSSVNFEVRHLEISKVQGTFDTFEGKIDIDPMTKQIKKFEGEIEIKSVNTKNKKRDTHLRSDEFFDAKKFQKGSFVMKKFQDNKLYGDLTLHGITKPVVFDAAVYGPSITPSNKKEFMALEITGEISRKDFDIGMGFANVIVSDQVKVSILLEVRE